MSLLDIASANHIHPDFVIFGQNGYCSNKQLNFVTVMGNIQGL